MEKESSGYEKWLLMQTKGGSHYYGDSIRIHMLIAAALLVILMAIDRDLLAFYLSFGIVFVLFSFILAGLTNPESKNVIIADVIMSLLIFSVFEFLAIAGYIKSNTFFDTVFLLRQAIAIISLGSLYLGTKTLRGMYYKEKSKDDSGSHS